MHKPLLLLLAMWLLPAAVAAQTQVATAPERDLLLTAHGFAYYITLDGRRIPGLRIAPIVQDRMLVLEQPGHERTVFLPGDILEYGLETGERYMSAEIALDGSPRKVFLEMLIEDPGYQVFVYEHKKDLLFYLRKDGTLTRIDDNGAALKKLMSAEARHNGDTKADEIDRYTMKLNRTSVTAVYDAYRLDNTKLLKRPVRFGIGVGFNLNRMNIKGGDLEYKSKFSVSPYLFVDVPLDPQFSLVGELHYRSVDFRSRDTNTGRLWNVVEGTLASRRHSLYIPLTARYTMTYLQSRTMPYIEAGATADILVGGGCDIRPKETMAQSLWGAVIGAGAEVRMSVRHSFFFSVRFNYLTGKTQDGFFLKENNKFFSVNAGYSF